MLIPINCYYFNQIIKNFQIEIFSNPKKKGPVKTHQAGAINILIKNKLQYAEKKDLKLRVQISNDYRADLINYISDHYLKFGESLNNELDKVLSKWILKRKKNTSDLNEMKNLYLKLNEFVSQSLNYDTISQVEKVIEVTNFTITSLDKERLYMFISILLAIFSIHTTNMNVSTILPTYVSHNHKSLSEISVSYIIM